MNKTPLLKYSSIAFIGLLSGLFISSSILNYHLNITRNMSSDVVPIIITTILTAFSGCLVNYMFDNLTIKWRE